MAKRASDEQARRLRLGGRAIAAYGLVAAGSWGITRDYAGEVGGSVLWTIAIVTSLGYLVVGALIAIFGARFQPVARVYAAALAIGGFVLPRFLSGPSAVSAFTIVASGATLLLVWGKPGKARTIAGLVSLALCAFLLVFGITRKLQRPPWPELVEAR